MGLFGLFFGFFWVLYCLIFVAAFAFFFLWLWMLYDCLKREDYAGPNDKLLWALVILFAGIIGAALYYFLVKARK